MSRRLGASALALVVGAIGLAGPLLAGYLIYERLFGDSLATLIVMVGIFGAVGLYAGWIMGMVVYSAARGTET